MAILCVPHRLQHTLLRHSLHHQELDAPLLAARMVQTVQALVNKVGSVRLPVLSMYLSFIMYLR